MPTRRSFLTHTLLGVAAPILAPAAARTLALPSHGGDTHPVINENPDTSAVALAEPVGCDLVPAGFAPMPVGDTRYSASPTITRLPPSLFYPDRLRLAWFLGDNHTSYGTATIMTSVSEDDGATWSTPTAYPWANSARDPGLSTAGSRVWLTYFTGTAVHPASGVYARESLDGGATFASTPRRVDPRMNYAATSAPLRAIGDRLVVPFYGRRDGDNQDSAWLATLRPGSSWWSSVQIADGQADGRGYAEPWLLDELNVPGDDSGRRRVFHRYGLRDRIGITESVDGGQSWTRRPLFPGWGKPAALRMSTGQLVVVYRSITDSSAVYAISRDDGVTWDHGRVLIANTAGTDLGMIYAAPVEVPGGRVYVVVSMETPGPAGARLWHGHLECP